ncbi:MAG: S8 family peptidase [Lachnospiraceae bacterium]|nr:S8 family peptidase [Lachnospiraceae bacterium]
MTCEEMIYSNDFSDLMINYQKDDRDLRRIYENGCINAINEKIAIIHIPRSQEYLTNLESVPYSFIPKLYGLMDSSNLEVTGVKQIQNPNNLGLTGKNVIVGIIDTGIDYTNPLFSDINGNTRIGVLWDQTVRDMEKSDEVPIPYYGTAFSRSQIDNALQSENPYEIVPSRDEDGHGTFMSGIAVGGVNRENDFTGIATEAEIAVVKVKQTKSYLRQYFGIPENVPAYQETDIMYAVDYLVKYARQRSMPISIFIGLGSSNGGHIGLTFLERYLDYILENVGIMVSVSAGNEGSERLHYSGQMDENTGSQEVELNVGEGQEVLTMEFWGNAPTTFSIGIISPQGDQIERIPPRFGQEELLWLPIAKSTVYVAYQLIETFSGDELIFIRLNNPTPGIWRFIVYADENNPKTFNMWMPLRQFLRPETYFLRADPNNTITIPGNSELVMTMTAYNHLNGSIYAQASRGYYSQIQVKPDLTAPGVNIMGPGRRNNFVTMSGTSIAAAHSAGIMALFLQWNIENYNLNVFFAMQIKNFFIKNAIRNPLLIYPNEIWGYGIINVERVFDSFRVTNFPI